MNDRKVFLHTRGMLVLLIGYLLFIAVFVFPFPLDVNAYFSLRTKQAGSNFKLGFFTIDVGIKLGPQGFEIDGIKSKEEKSVKANKDKLDILYNPRILEKININSVNLIFQYGNLEDAYGTCMLCNAVDNLSIITYNLFSEKIKIFRKIIMPVFDKDSLFFQLRIDLKVNLFIIFSSLIKIILIKIRKKLKIGGQTV